MGPLVVNLIPTLVICCVSRKGILILAREVAQVCYPRPWRLRDQEGKVILSLGYMGQPELHEPQPQTKPNQT